MPQCFVFVDYKAKELAKVLFATGLGCHVKERKGSHRLRRSSSIAGADERQPRRRQSKHRKQARGRSCRQPRGTRHGSERSSAAHRQGAEPQPALQQLPQGTEPQSSLQQTQGPQCFSLSSGGEDAQVKDLASTPPRKAWQQRDCTPDKPQRRFGRQTSKDAQGLPLLWEPPAHKGRVPPGSRVLWSLRQGGPHDHHLPHAQASRTCRSGSAPPLQRMQEGPHTPRGQPRHGQVRGLRPGRAVGGGRSQEASATFAKQHSLEIEASSGGSWGEFGWPEAAESPTPRKGVKEPEASSAQATNPSKGVNRPEASCAKGSLE
jgi:hypothetical protein